MTSRPARPRRSEPKSYVDLFKPLDLGSSSSEEGEGEGEGEDAPAGPSSPQSKKKKGKGKLHLPLSDEDDSDISEWEEELKPTTKDGAPLASTSSDDDDDVGSAVETDDSDGAGGAEEEFDSDDSGFRSPSGPTRGRGRHSPVLKHQGAAARKPRISVATPSAPSRPKPTSRRVQPPQDLPPSLIEITLATIGPQYEPPIRKLVPGARSVVEGKVEQRREHADDGMRMRGLEGWALTPFGPERALLQDLGWWKGKWSEGEGMNSRWGGWFEDVQTDVGEKVDEEAVAPYLPHLVFPSLPTEIDLPRHLLPDPHALPPTKKGGDTAMEEDDDGEAPPEEEEEQAQAEEREKLKVWLGSLKNGEEGQEKIELGRFESRRLDEFLPRKPGFIFNAGGAVMGLDWCPLPHPPSPVEYLALTTISSHSASISRTINPGPSLIQIWSLDMTTPSDFAIETDKEEGGEGMKMVMGLCIEEGDAWEVKWCPRGGSGEEDAMQVDGEENGRLGILAGAFADGSVSLFAVPDPKKAGAEEGKVLYLKAKPILKLTLPDTTCDSIAWASHETIAAGCNNGYIAIWDVGSALRSGATITRPLQYFPTHTASIRSLTFLRTPPLHRSLDGTLNTDQEPTYIASAGHDGSTTLIDLADTTAPVVITHDRGFIGAIAWSPHTGCIVTHDADAAVRLISIKAKDFAATRAVVKLTGVVHNLATSDHHPFVASASADGACTLSNAARTSKKKAYKGHYFHRVFRLDFNRLLGEYRMIDNLHVESTVGIDSTLRPPSKATAKNDYAAITGAWAPEINVSRVCWHPSLNRACLLASGTVSGLVRVDWVEGGAPGS